VSEAITAEAVLEATTTRVDARLEQFAQELGGGAPLVEAVRYAISGGGKRLRPALCVAAYRAAGGEQEGIIDIAAAIELIHTYSLVHDDLPCMDDDALRRGRPTTHVVYGSAIAAVAGAALIPLAFRLLARGGEQLDLASATIRAMTRELATAAGGSGMIGGQLLDLAAEGHAIAIDDLEAIHHAKTGALIAASVRCGALAAGAAPPVLQALRGYGRALGLAFQIMDDLLDETANTAALGKTAGKDRARKKATFPAMLGLEQTGARAREELAAALHAIHGTGLGTAELEALARFAIERKH